MFPTGAENDGVKVEDIGGMLTDVLRLGPTASDAMLTDPTDTQRDEVLFFVVPGNPGTLAFYKGTVYAVKR
jgi:hypothetical protein